MRQTTTLKELEGLTLFFFYFTWSWSIWSSMLTSKVVNYLICHISFLTSSLLTPQVLPTQAQLSPPGASPGNHSIYFTKYSSVSSPMLQCQTPLLSPRVSAAKVSLAGLFTSQFSTLLQYPQIPTHIMLVSSEMNWLTLLPNLI